MNSAYGPAGAKALQAARYEVSTPNSIASKTGYGWVYAHRSKKSVYLRQAG